MQRPGNSFWGKPKAIQAKKVHREKTLSEYTQETEKVGERSPEAVRRKRDSGRPPAKLGEIDQPKGKQ